MVTVGTFHTLLISKLTQHDLKLASKERNLNIFRIGHYCRAAQEVLATCGLPETTVLETQSAEAYKAALCRHFTMDPPIAPIRNVLRQLDAFIATGKRPSLVRR